MASNTMRELAEEVPVALTYNGSSHAVMMATPGDLEDFAIGFSFAERIIDRVAEIESLDVIDGEDGIEIRTWLSPGAHARLMGRRRNLLGAAGCGLCGIESIDQALPQLVPVGGRVRIAEGAIIGATAALSRFQPINAVTRAVHAAALWDCDEGAIIAVREDVGRHNALDKIGGFLLGGDTCAGRRLALVMTSRVSIELVQKAVRLGIEVMIAVSAPTALAVRAARQANVTIIGVARQDGYEVFTGPDRVTFPSNASRVEVTSGG